jgi:hypothetical protein
MEMGICFSLFSRTVLKPNNCIFISYFRDDHDILSHGISFNDHNYTLNRVVTDLDWSPQISELILASYSENE